MKVLEKFEKQPADVIDYDIDFAELWLKERDDKAVSFTLDVDEGIHVESSAMIDGVVKVFLSGGVDGHQYKVTATVKTQNGRTKQAEILVKVKEL